MHLWYAAFGSNLSRDRFLIYLQGGVPPHSPNPAPQPGARDRTPPTAEWVGEVEAELYFATSSQRWGGGGVAFLEVDPSRFTRSRPVARIRAYRLSLSQLEDVYGQENGVEARPAIDVDVLVHHGHLDLLPRRYGRLAVVGFHDGAPLVTITSSEQQEVNSPSFAYARTIVAGLTEAFGLSVDEAVQYLIDSGVDEEAAFKFAARLREN